MRTLIAVLAVVSALACARAANSAPSEPACHIGAYRLTSGEIVDVTGEGRGLRWRTLSGRTGGLRQAEDGGWIGSFGWTDDPDPTRVAFGECDRGRLTLGGAEGRLVPLQMVEATFRSHGVILAGRLVLPAGSARAPVMVLGHGSERASALDTYFRQRLYPAAGVGVFVFDKRGTGRSGGSCTQDFSLLADDLAAAMAEARRLAGPRAARVGFQGGSQAGWVLPLAAQRAHADFVIVGYGIAASPVAEDRNETLQDLEAAGWGRDVLAKGAELADAAAELIRSRFTRGFPRFNALVARYRAEPWFKDLKGEYTGELTRHTEAELRLIGPAHDEGTPWDYDAVGALRRLRAPLLWMVAGADTEGAGPETPDALFGLQRQGRPVTVAVFPDAEHGIHEFVTRRGVREHVRYAPGYFRMELDFARSGRLVGDYGPARVFPPLSGSRSPRSPR